VAVRDVDPPPGAVFELAERAVDFVRTTMGLVLDYTGDTLPVLDHYLRQVPEDQPDTVRLIAACAGAYFGEVIRRQLGGAWEDTTGEPAGWQLLLPGPVRLQPVGVAGQAIIERDDDEAFDGGFAVPEAAQAAVEEALTARGDVSEEEFYSLSGRLEVLMLVTDVAVASTAPGQS
jgi:hypothetical protein